jgi:hypothetical protein
MYEEDLKSSTHPALVRQLLPNMPAKNRSTSNTSSEFAPQHAALKAVNGRKVNRKIRRRPSTSPAGAQSRGPTTKPSTNTEVTIMYISFE